jgi:hypothetical protein
VPAMPRNSSRKIDRAAVARNEVIGRELERKVADYGLSESN